MKTSNLIKILETSVVKNGAAHQLTVGHLLNIVKMVERFKNKEEEFERWLDEEAKEYGKFHDFNQYP